MIRWREDIRVSFAALMAGGLFIFLPIMGFYDYVPDLFGYVLICFGLWRLSDLSDSFAESLGLFRKLALISAGQMITQRFIHVIFPAFERSLEELGTATVIETENSMLILLASFVWAVLNWIFLVPAMKSLFSGFGALTFSREECAIGKRKKNTARWEGMMRLSVFFAIAIPLLSLLPELSILTTMNLQSAKPTFRFDWYEYITMFRFVLGSIGAFIGLLWFAFFVRFFVLILRDRPFCDSLEIQYREEVAPRRKWLAYRRTSLAFSILTVGILCAANVRIDGNPLFPSGVFVLLTALGVCLLGVVRNRFFLPFCGVGAVTAVLGTIHQSWLAEYLSHHEIKDAGYFSNAYEAFTRIRVIECAYSIAQVLFFALMLLLLFQSVVRLEQNLDVSLMGKDRSRYVARLVICGVLAIAMTVMNCAHAILQINVSYLWWLSLVAHLGMLFVCRGFMMDLRDEIFSSAREEWMHKR